MASESPAVDRPGLRARRRLRQALPWALALGALLLLTLPVTVRWTDGWDIWWHLATGRLALASGSTLPTDPFSVGFFGQPWHHKDLAADLLLWLSFARCGFAAFALWKMTAVALLFGALAWVVPPGRRRPLPLAVLTAALVLVERIWLIERPVLVSHVAFPLLVAALERLRRELAAADRRRTVALLAPVLALQWGWLWLHRGALLGFVVIAGYLLELAAAAWVAGRTGSVAGRAGRLAAALAPLLGPPPSRAARPYLLAALPLSLALGLLQPSGLALFASGLGVAGSAQLRDTVSEWTRLGPFELLARFPALLALAALALACWGAWAWRTVRRPPAAAPFAPFAPAAAAPSKLRLLHGLGLLGFGLLTLDSVRHAPALASFSACVLALALATPAAVGVEAPAPSRPRSRRWRTLAVATVALAWALHWALPGGDPLVLGERPDRYPKGALAFLAARQLDGPLVNAFVFGGYLIHHGGARLRVLVDGRNETVYPVDFLDQALRAQHDPAVFAAQRRRDRLDVVLASNLPDHETHRFLAADPDWWLVYWSEAALVYVRRQAHPELADLAYQLLAADPAAPHLAVLDGLQRAARTPWLGARLGRELARAATASPRSLRVGAARVLYCHLRGPAAWAERDRLLALLVAWHGPQPALVALADRLDLTLPDPP